MIELFDDIDEYASRKVNVTFWTFPAGERGVKINPIYES